MKKSLLPMLMVPVLAANATAAEPQTPKSYDGYVLSAISPNGKFAASDCYGMVVYINLETGAEITFTPDDNGNSMYCLGSGNALSNDGLMMCSQDMNGDASYFDGTEWKALHIGDTNGVNSAANAVTPDGSRICGNLGLHEMTYDDVTMCVPVIWNRQSDGSFGEYVMLPHPDLDLFGTAPQYVTATHISDDGHTVLGQVTDSRGFVLYPILYKEAADGTWSYSLPFADLFNPDHIVIPENPGEDPKQPEAKDFMTDEQKAAFEQAVADWQAGQGEYPDENEYLSGEGKTEFEQALAEWQTAHAEWSERWSAFDDAYWAVASSSPTFESNQNALASDGSAFAATSVTEDDSDPMAWMPVQVYHPWTYDIASGQITKYEDKSMGITGYAGGYWLATETDAETSCYNGYMLKNGSVTSLYDFLCSKGDPVKEWVEVNMNHQIESFDYETEQVVTKDFIVTGLPHATPDLRYIISWTFDAWNQTYEPVSYLFDLGEGAAVSETFADKKAAMFDAEGNLVLGADVKAVAIYDVAGRCVKNAAAQTVACGDLADGVYIVNVTYADGTIASVKIVK